MHGYWIISMVKVNNCSSIRNNVRLFLELTSDTIILPWTKCIYIIAVFCAIKQMVLTPFPGWSSRDPDTLSTWFPNMECFKGPPYPPPSPRGGLDVCARIHTLPVSLPPPLLLIHLIQFLGFLLSPSLTHMCIVIRRGSGGGWGLGVGKEGGFNHLV